MSACGHIPEVKCRNCEPLNIALSPFILPTPHTHQVDSDLVELKAEVTKLAKLVRSLQDQLLSMDREIRALRRDHSQR